MNNNALYNRKRLILDKTDITKDNNIRKSICWIDRIGMFRIKNIVCLLFSFQYTHLHRYLHAKSNVWYHIGSNELDSIESGYEGLSKKRAPVEVTSIDEERYHLRRKKQPSEDIVRTDEVVLTEEVIPTKEVI